ncbi:hypothetical protein MRBLWH7_000346 [Microbacterium sp. LWH7-1.2]|uniref:hypothetical protein n=1 Tax=Microbacterium sp. LWH7-1.2 TaxID=3135257 RepID=UPI003138EFE4
MKRKKHTVPEPPPGKEWVTPKRMPDTRVAVFVIPDGAPDDVREGIARQRIAAVDGACPCGGAVYVLDAEGFWCEHEDDCPGLDRNLLVAMREWRASGWAGR